MAARAGSATKGTQVRTAFGEGTLKDVRPDNVHVVELKHGTAYLQKGSVKILPKPFSVGDRVATPYGDATVVEHRADAKQYVVDMTRWRLANDTQPRAYLAANLVSRRHRRSARELLDETLRTKDRGNDLFKHKQFKEAIAMYRHSIMLCRQMPSHNFARDLNADRQRAMYTTLFACHLNLAQCSRKINMPAEAVKFCDVALALDAQHKLGNTAKVLVRRGHAKYESKDFSGAAKDFKDAQTVLKDAPPSKQRTAFIKEIKEWHPKSRDAAKAARSKEKANWGGVFDKAPGALSADAPPKSPSRTNGTAAGAGAASGAAASPLPRKSLSADQAGRAATAPAKPLTDAPSGDLVNDILEGEPDAEASHSLAATASEDSSSALTAGLAGIGLLGLVVLGVMWARRRS